MPTVLGVWDKARNLWRNVRRGGYVRFTLDGAERIVRMQLVYYRVENETGELVLEEQR